MRVFIMFLFAAAFACGGVSVLDSQAQQIPFQTDKKVSIGVACGMGDSKWDSGGNGLCGAGVQFNPTETNNVSMNLIGAMGFGYDSNDLVDIGESVKPWNVSAGIAFGF